MTGVILRRLTDCLEGAIILKKWFFKTYKMSYIRNKDMILSNVTKWTTHIPYGWRPDSYRRSKISFYRGMPNNSSKNEYGTESCVGIST